MKIFSGRLLTVVVLSLLGPSCGGGGEGTPNDDDRCGATEVSVARVIDGDTVALTDDTRIRYLLIDAPEIAHAAGEVSDCFGDEAKLLNQQLVEGKSVRLEFDAECQDMYGRTLAYVWLGERMVNEILLERGYARLLVIPPNTKYEDELKEIEDEAKATRAGLWGACE